jgi:hypothetical protein
VGIWKPRSSRSNVFIKGSLSLFNSYIDLESIACFLFLTAVPGLGAPLTSEFSCTPGLASGVPDDDQTMDPDAPKLILTTSAGNPNPYDMEFRHSLEVMGAFERDEMVIDTRVEDLMDTDKSLQLETSQDRHIYGFLAYVGKPEYYSWLMDPYFDGEDGSTVASSRGLGLASILRNALHFRKFLANPEGHTDFIPNVYSM